MENPPDFELVELRDAAEVAERAVTHWQEKVQQKLDAIRYLGSFFSWLEGTVTGTRRQQLDSAVAAVEKARERLARARQARDEALARLALVEQDRVDQAAVDEARRARREAIAEQVRISPHPLAQRFNELETQLDAVRLEHDTLRHAYVTGTALAASMKSTQLNIEHRMASSTRESERRIVPSVDDSRMKRLESQAQAFEDACATTGLSIRIHVAVPVRDRLGNLVRKWGHSWVAGMMSAVEAEQFHSSLQTAIDETEGALGAMHGQLEELAAQVARLQAERGVILDQFDR